MPGASGMMCDLPRCRANRGVVMRTMGVCSIGTIVSDGGAAGAIPPAKSGIPIQSYMQGPGGMSWRGWDGSGHVEGQSRQRGGLARREQASTDVVAFRVGGWFYGWVG